MSKYTLHEYLLAEDCKQKEREQLALKLKTIPLSLNTAETKHSFEAGQSVVLDIIRWRLDIFKVVRVFTEGGRDRVEIRRERSTKSKIVSPKELRPVNDVLLADLKRKQDFEDQAKQFRQRHKSSILSK